MSKIDWGDELIDRICDEVSSGRSVAELSKEGWCPSQPSIYREMARNEDFADRMGKARAAQQEYEADNCVALADAATNEDWQVVKLRIWARQWRAAKLAPKKYGDKLDLTNSDNSLSSKTTEELQARLAALRASNDGAG